MSYVSRTLAPGEQILPRQAALENLLADILAAGAGDYRRRMGRGRRKITAIRSFTSPSLCSASASSPPCRR